MYSKNSRIGVPCTYYECKGSCSKGKEADMAGHCLVCKSYRPRKGSVSTNRKREKNLKISSKEAKKQIKEYV